MILKCPECTTRFLVNEALLGPHGRKVKCASCKHVWFQEPERHDGDAFNNEDSFVPPIEDIPESVKPVPEGSNLPVPTDDNPFSALYGLAASIVLAVFLIGATIPVRQHVVKTWEPSALLYETIGFHVPVVGEGIKIENIEVVEIPEGEMSEISMSAFLRNDTDGIVQVPALKIQLLGEQEEVSTIDYKPDFDVLMPFQSNKITLSHQLAQGGAMSALISFDKETEKAHHGDEKQSPDDMPTTAQSSEH